MKLLRPSYHWVIVFGGILGLMASLGFGRFALGMMLPALSEALALNYRQMGWIGTVNFCGYLLAVLFCGFLAKKLGSRLLISLALALVGGSMVAIGFTENFLLISLLYFVTGIGSALANVPIMALIGGWFSHNTRGRAAGLCTMGNGGAILLAGKMVPSLNNSSWGWRSGWLVFGAATLLIAFICALILRNPPRIQQGTGHDEETTGGRQATGLRAAGMGIFYFCSLIYFLFGFAYVIYVTFFVTSLVQDHGLTEAAAGQLYSRAGLISLVSGLLFGYLSDKFGRKRILITVFIIHGTAYLLMAGRFPSFAVHLSILCYGIAAWSIPTVMAALVADYAGSQRAAAMFGMVTFFFGIGQIAGPAIAGVLAETSGTLFSSFLLAGLTALFAALLSSFLPRNSPPAS